MKRMVAPGRWEDVGPRLVYSPGRMVGAVPLSVAVPTVTTPWPIPRPNGTPLSRQTEYRREYERERYLRRKAAR